MKRARAATPAKQRKLTAAQRELVKHAARCFIERWRERRRAAAEKSAA
jgi:hypothetical protein